MFLQADDVTHRSLDIHRAAFTRRYSYTERFAHNFFLYTDAFTQGGFYAKKGSIYTQIDALYKNVFARTNKGT